MKSKLLEKVRVAALPVTTAAMVAVPTFMSYAAESGAADVDLATITNEAMTSIKGDMMVVIVAAVGVSVSLIGITVGIAFLLKKLKGLKTQVS